MSDERTVTIKLQESMPLVQSSGSLNNGNGVNNQQNLSTASTNKSQATTPQMPTANSSSGISIQTTLPGSNSFVVGTKANQMHCISDAPITDPGGSNAKQVKLCVFAYLCEQLNDEKQKQ